MSFFSKLRARLSMLGQKPPAVAFADFSETPPDELLPYLDRSVVDEASLTPTQREWRETGVVILRNFIPDEVTAPYIAVREALGEEAGWLECAPYMHVEEMRDLALYPPLMAKMKEVIGEDMMLHLCLTGWISTKREWHQDDYLNPDFVNCWYIAIWIALDDIHPDSGPFEYIPGSHRWPLMRGEKIRALLTEEEQDMHWPKWSERFTTPAAVHEIKKSGVKVKQFLAKRGDVLLWHGRLMHQGAKPNDPNMERRSLIAHYSSSAHRPDIHEDYRARDENGQIYIVFGVSTAI